jgi:hypothetical protein
MVTCPAMQPIEDCQAGSSHHTASPSIAMDAIHSAATALLMRG